MPFDEGAAPVFEAKVLAGAYAPSFYFWKKGVMDDGNAKRFAKKAT